MDTRTQEQRSRIMRSVGVKDTKPELILRRLLHRLGYRYSLHRRDLPGRPDLVFPARGKVIFVHGCYWHGHDCQWGRLPKTRLDYWGPKIAANHARDARVNAELIASGWQPHTVWQCELRNPQTVVSQVADFLGQTGYGAQRSRGGIRRHGATTRS